MSVTKYRIYVLRVWLERADGDAHVWRASLTNTATKERKYFATLEELSGFLPQLQPQQHPSLTS